MRPGPQEVIAHFYSVLINEYVLIEGTGPNFTIAQFHDMLADLLTPSRH